ncbi:hypothetical protein [Magnetospirillum moscoviense]|uniref:Uncharacterized protein n=1 Tax=Magnetospirillum moscoviense TaxID=1437059 RepID=A0A178MY56_9PROT|nr:hypothetical protein [Magnetospirillum moscoviense]MBF0324122.1 hypothetical protein [Alphaproteobacteria bacterium]OAN59552.1 hypothetical protein A6A05_07375 [Magnetospirillum moscoviense]
MKGLEAFLVTHRHRLVWLHAAMAVVFAAIGLLLGVFSRLGAVQFAPKNPVPGGDAWTEKGVCPTMIDLPRKQESRHCIQCLRCVNPQARGALEIRLRSPGTEIERIAHHHPNIAEVWFLFLGTGVALGGFLWLDFLMISGFMLSVMAAMTTVLASLTAATARLSGRPFAQVGYLFAPVAMVSLVVGLGGMLFQPLGPWAGTAKAVLFLAGIVWSLWLGWRVMAPCPPLRRLLALIPAAAGVVAVAWGWAPAPFGG